MDYQCRTDIPGFSTPPDFFDDESEEKINERFIDWAYTALEDPSRCYELLEALEFEDAKDLVNALVEVKLGHEMNNTLKVTGGQIMDFLREEFERDVL